MIVPVQVVPPVDLLLQPVLLAVLVGFVVLLAALEDAVLALGVVLRSAWLAQRFLLLALPPRLARVELLHERLVRPAPVLSLAMLLRAALPTLLLITAAVVRRGPVALVARPVIPVRHLAS